MATQVLIIHGQLAFAIKLKQTLERNAPFEVHPFTEVDAALEYLHNRVQDVAVIDFTTLDDAGEEVLRQLRETQENLALIVIPSLDDATMSELGILASLDADYDPRDLIRIINEYFNETRLPSNQPPTTTGLLSRVQRDAQQPDSIPETGNFDHVMISTVNTDLFGTPRRADDDTPPSAGEDIAALFTSETSKPNESFDDVLNALPPDAATGTPATSDVFTDLVNSMRGETTHRPLPSRQQQFVEFILTGGMESLLDEIEQQGGTADDGDDAGDVDDDVPSSIFERLAQEEPPMPTFEESGTVSDLLTGVQDKSFQHVMSILRGEEIPEESEQIAAPEASEFETDGRPQIKPLRPREEYRFDFDEDDDSKPTPAKVILQRTLEQSMSGEFSLEDLLANIERQLPAHRPKVLPLPSWLREEKQEDAFTVAEPEFLPEEIPPQATGDSSVDIYAEHRAATRPSHGQQIEPEPGNLETEWFDERQGVPSQPPETLPEEIPADPTVVHQYPPDEAPAYEFDQPPAEAERLTEPDYDFSFDELGEDEAGAPDEASVYEYDFDEAQVGDAQPRPPVPALPELSDSDFNTQFELMAAFEFEDELGVTTGALYTETAADAPPAQYEQRESIAHAPPEVSEPEVEEDPYIAQLALSLTAVSLELTAEATLLARDGEIVAYAGELPDDEVEELRELIADDWNAAPGEVRIRFVTAQGSGIDYMLYSRRTEDDLTLSLIFAGTTPLRDIRRQGQRLVEALASVPEAPPTAAKPKTQAMAAIEDADAVARTPYTCVWLLADPNAYLDEAVSQAIIAGLTIQLREKQWIIESLQIHEDHVYLQVDVPGDEPAYAIMRELKTRSAEIAHAQNPAYSVDGLWSDGYLIVTPGRELDVEEIQQFINFERMG